MNNPESPEPTSDNITDCNQIASAPFEPLSLRLTALVAFAFFLGFVLATFIERHQP